MTIITISDIQAMNRDVVANTKVQNALRERQAAKPSYTLADLRAEVERDATTPFTAENLTTDHLCAAATNAKIGARVFAVIKARRATQPSFSMNDLRREVRARERARADEPPPVATAVSFQAKGFTQPRVARVVPISTPATPTPAATTQIDHEDAREVRRLIEHINTLATIHGPSNDRQKKAYVAFIRSSIEPQGAPDSGRALVNAIADAVRPDAAAEEVADLKRVTQAYIAGLKALLPHSPEAA